MKTKIVLPLLAVALALVTAFATPVAQTGWYDEDGTGPAPAVSGTITTPAGDTPVCGQYGASICTINFAFAYADANSATNQLTSGLLRFDPEP